MQRREPALIYDSAEHSSSPALHALIVGIDSYPYFRGGINPPMSSSLYQLSSSVNSAVRVSRWVTSASALLPAPLGSVRLLLSPLENVEPPEPEPARATLQNILDAVEGWYGDADSREDNVAFFYWAGHGVQHEPDDLALLLEDFGRHSHQPFHNSLSFQNLYLGMAKAAASLQLYFVDTSRSVPYEMRGHVGIRPTAIFGIDLETVDKRVAPIFYSTVPGGTSFARAGGTTIFSDALLSCLEGTAAEPTEDYDRGAVRWQISISSLNRQLHREMSRVSDWSLAQSPTLSGLVRDATICRLREPPRSRALVFDDREPAQGREQLHAFIVGVSSYPFLPGGPARGPRNTAFPELKQLSCAANSAYLLYEWLRTHKDDLAAPVASIRLLLSPSPIEVEGKQALRDTGDRATLSNFLLAAAEWRNVLCSTKDGIGLFYFSGHGAQRQSGDSVLLLEDVGDGIGGLLRNTVEVNNLLQGLAPHPTQRQIARKQLFLIDACRMRVADFRRYEWMTTSQVFNVEYGGTDDRAAPILSATSPGSEAYGIAGDASIFGRALLDCLNNAIMARRDGAPGTPVSIRSLEACLEGRIAELNALHGTSQRITPSGLYRDFELGRAGLVK